MIYHVDRALEGERVFDLGQLSPATLQELNRLVQFGVLVRRAQPCGRAAYDTKPAFSQARLLSSRANSPVNRRFRDKLEVYGVRSSYEEAARAEKRLREVS